MPLIALADLDALFRHYGYGAIFAGVLLESSGLPLPGESLLIAASLYAATTHHLAILLLVPAAAMGAILGDQIGYAIGRHVGVRVLERWGRRVGLSAERLELGRYLFRRYGGRVVFLGRFVAVLRTFAALLAGANRMPWPRFLLWNALGDSAGPACMVSAPTRWATRRGVSAVRSGSRWVSSAPWRWPPRLSLSGATSGGCWRRRGAACAAAGRPRPDPMPIVAGQPPTALMTCLAARTPSPAAPSM